MERVAAKQIITSSLTAVVLLCFVHLPDLAITIVLSRSFLFFTLILALLTMTIRSFRKLKRKIMTPVLQLALTPVIVAIISIYGVLVLNNIDRDAKNKLRESAEKIQEICRIKGVVPSSLVGWEKDGGLLHQTVQIDKTTYQFFYNPLQESKEYIIGINYGPDIRYELNGGVNKPLDRYRRNP